MTGEAAAGSARCRGAARAGPARSISFLAVGIWARKFAACRPRYSPGSGGTSAASVVEAGASV